MKLKKFNLFQERLDEDDIFEDDTSEENEDDMQYLCHLLRQMFTNSGVQEVLVDHMGLNISISVQFYQKEPLKELLKIFNIVKKIKKDILAQYEDSFELWEDRNGPAITFDFILDDYKSSGKGYVWDDTTPW